MSITFTESTPKDDPTAVKTEVQAVVGDTTNKPLQATVHGLVSRTLGWLKAIRTGLFILVYKPGKVSSELTVSSFDMNLLVCAPCS